MLKQIPRDVLVFLFLGGIMAVLIIVIAASLFFRPTESKSIQQAPGVETSDRALSSEEKRLSQATPQPLRHENAKSSGTLVVTSNVPDVKVLLDAGSHPDKEDPIPSGQKWPQNTTPFTVYNVPEGDHVLFAANPPRYDTSEVKFTIIKGQITRVHITLIPLRTSQ